jgi:hypothetical protein
MSEVPLYTKARIGQGVQGTPGKSGGPPQHETMAKVDDLVNFDHCFILFLGIGQRVPGTPGSAAEREGNSPSKR